MIPVEISAPWGKEKLTTHLELVGYARKQLLYYIDRKESPNPLRTAEDLAGYDELIALGCEATAERFLKLKQQKRRLSERTPNARAIAELKRMGKWGSNAAPA